MNKCSRVRSSEDPFKWGEGLCAIAARRQRYRIYNTGAASLPSPALKSIILDTVAGPLRGQGAVAAKGQARITARFRILPVVDETSKSVDTSVSSMDYVDLTRAALSALQFSTSADSEYIDHAEAHCLRGKILGVLIRQSRLAAEVTSEDCARYLSVKPQLIEAWELGERVPSLPQLERLASCFKASMFNEPLSAVILPQAEQDEHMRIRQRLVGALLQSARRAREASLEDISARTGLDTDLLNRYEYGESTMPAHHLAAIAQAVQRDLSYFTDSAGVNLRRTSASARRTATANNEDADLAQFAADQRNRAFIRLAMAFRDIDRKDLNQIASALLAIIRERREDNGRSPT